MKKKLTAFLTAAVCALSPMGILPILSGAASNNYLVYFVIVATEPTHTICAWTGNMVSDGMSFLSDEQMEQIFGTAEEYPVSGEIIGLDVSSWGGKEPSYICKATYSGFRKADVVGSVYDLPTVECYYDGAYGLADAEGNILFGYDMRVFEDGYQSPEGFPDLTNVKAGDKMTMAVVTSDYGSFPVSCVDLTPLGDVNADSTLNILDVILLNKAVLIGEPLPALETAAKSGETDYGQCDFNGNGTLDLDDSLGMMKRIIGIEETE